MSRQTGDHRFLSHGNTHLWRLADQFSARHIKHKSQKRILDSRSGSEGHYCVPWCPSQSSGLLNRKNANSFAFLNPVPFAELRAFNRQKANSLAFWNPSLAELGIAQPERSQIVGFSKSRLRCTTCKYFIARIMIKINKKAPVFRLGLFH